MKHPIVVCIPLFTRYDLIWKCINSFGICTIKPDLFVIINNGLLPFVSNSRYVKVFNFRRNIGVATSWNFFCKKIKGIKIISNDDVCVTSPKFVENFCEGLEKFDLVFSAESPGFHIFSLSSSCFSAVGDFDEKFYPAYFEDMDYHYRMKLLGRSTGYLADCKIDHVGSATKIKLNRNQRREHLTTFPLLKEYYIKKWGGEPGSETLTVPNLS